MSFLPKVAAVFATMNRAQTALACLRALAAQTRPPDLVVVADNVSSDDTVRHLERLAGLPFRLVVHQMAENRGNAGGVQEAMDLAFSEGADAVWILDDDSWPRSDALAALLTPPWDPEAVRHSLQIDPRTGRLTWPMWIDRGGVWKLAWELDALPAENLFSSRCSWTGSLISRKVRDKVGPVNGCLFIRGEDEEYPLRILDAGFSFAAVRSSVLDHPGPRELIHWRILGRHFFLEPGLAGWKLYYKVRNNVWLKRRHSGPAAALSVAGAFLAATCIVNGIVRLPLVLRACRDGWNGKLGRTANLPID